MSDVDINDELLDNDNSNADAISTAYSLIDFRRSESCNSEFKVYNEHI